jgi:hypothetical protein
LGTKQALLFGNVEPYAEPHDLELFVKDHRIRRK